MTQNKAKMTLDLFDSHADFSTIKESLGSGTAILRGLALMDQTAILESLRGVAARAPFRHMTTPGGCRMSVAMTNCGTLGWVSDRRGYRYDAIDPNTRSPWPSIPLIFADLARRAARMGGFDSFQPDACPVNRYEPGARLTLHQDKNERDFTHPIVSVSLGLPAIFQFGGEKRSDPVVRVPVVHGDVLVWGGPARLRFHGVLPLKHGSHPATGIYRFNLTFRRAA